MTQDEVYSYSPKESEREKRRDKKRRPRMQISGRSVVELARIIAGQARRAEPLGGARRKKGKK